MKKIAKNFTFLLLGIDYAYFTSNSCLRGIYILASNNIIYKNILVFFKVVSI